MDDNDKMPTESEGLEDPLEELEPAEAAAEDVTFSPGGEEAETPPEFEAVEIGSKSPEAEAPEVMIPEEALAPEKTRGGRFKDAIRKGFIWLLVFSFVYLAGVVTMYILEVQPAKDALEETQLELEDANQAILDLRVDLDQAEFDLSYNTYLQVVADVYAARLALLDEDTSSAKIYLTSAEDNLALILEDVAAFDRSLADSLAQRLSLVMTNVDADIERALQDAAVLSDDLEKVYDGVYSTD